MSSYSLSLPASVVITQNSFGSVWTSSHYSAQPPTPNPHDSSCQVRVYSGRGSGQVWTKVDEGQGQGAGQEVSPARVGDCLDSTTKDNKR